jgi:hypothetical protein
VDITILVDARMNHLIMKMRNNRTGTRIFAFTVPLALASGCFGQPAAPGVRYQTRHFEKIALGCGEEKDKPCVTFHVDYPEFTVAPSEDVRRALNHDVQVMTNTNPENQEGTALIAPLSEQAARFIEKFDDRRSNFPDTQITYTVERKVSVVFENARVLSLKATGFEYMGGAHPNSFTMFHNIDLRTGQIIPLSEVVRPGSLPALNAAAEKALQEKKQIPDARTLEQAGYFVKNISLSDNYCIGENGLTFYFNSYDIAPNSMGPTEIFLPYSGIAALLNEASGLLPQ